MVAIFRGRADWRALDGDLLFLRQTAGRFDRGKSDSPRLLVLGFCFGIVFGFLLQKGGLTKYEVLMDQFLLTDFTVAKIMLTAITVGIVGVFSLRALGLVKLHVKPTR